MGRIMGRRKLSGALKNTRAESHPPHHTEPCISLRYSKLFGTCENACGMKGGCGMEFPDYSGYCLVNSRLIGYNSGYGQ